MSVAEYGQIQDMFIVETTAGNVVYLPFNGFTAMNEDSTPPRSQREYRCVSESYSPRSECVPVSERVRIKMSFLI